MKNLRKLILKIVQTLDVSVAKSKSGGGSVSRVEESTMPDNSTQIDPFFADLKFELAGLPENTEQVWKLTREGGDIGLLIKLVPIVLL